MSLKQTRALVEEIGRGCLNSRARLLSRVVNGIYDEQLRSAGIKSSQLNLLVAIAGHGPVRRTDIGKFMHLDSSTLTRNLRVMQTNGWIEDAPQGSDGRGSPVRITPAGEALLAKAAPAWREAQRRAGRLLGVEGKASLLELVETIQG